MFVSIVNSPITPRWQSKIPDFLVFFEKICSYVVRYYIILKIYFLSKFRSYKIILRNAVFTFTTQSITIWILKNSPFYLKDNKDNNSIDATSYTDRIYIYSFHMHTHVL